MNNIGLVYRDIGQLEQALDYFNQALPLLREVAIALEKLLPSIILMKSIKSSGNNRTNQPQALGIGNPKPEEPYGLPGAEAEIKRLPELLPGSEYYLRQEATLENFRLQALRQAKIKQVERHPFFWSPFVLIGDAR